MRYIKIFEDFRNIGSVSTKNQTVSQIVNNHLEKGKKVYLALKSENDAEKKIQNRLEDFNEKQSDLLHSIKTSFMNILTMDDKNLKETYNKYFEPQNSKYYLGSVLTAIYSRAFKEGFILAKNGDMDGTISEDLSNLIKIAEKLLQVKV